MDLEFTTEPIKVIHWDWLSDNYENDFHLEPKLQIQYISFEGMKMGFAVIMKTKFFSAKGQFASYIAQENIFIDLNLMEYNHFKKLTAMALRDYEEQFFEIVETDKMPFQFPLPAEELMKQLYESLKAQL